MASQESRYALTGLITSGDWRSGGSVSGRSVSRSGHSTLCIATSHHVIASPSVPYYGTLWGVKLSLKKVESFCKQRDTGIGDMLREAGVSRNAFYTLARKRSVVPQSLIRIAKHLGVSVSALLDDIVAPTERIKSLLAEATRISKRHRDVDRDNVRHTLLLLDEEPAERLRRALRRGRPVNIR